MSEDREKDQLEQLFHDRLYDYEAEVDASSWEAIQERLSPSEQQPIRRTLYYWIGAAAAAVVCLLLLIQSLEQPDPLDQPIERSLQAEVSETNPISGSSVVNPTQEHWVAQARVVPNQHSAVRQDRMVETQKPLLAALPSQPALLTTVPVSPVERIDQTVPVAPSAVAAYQGGEKRKARRWSVGMGAGTVSIGSDNVVPLYLMNNASLRSESLMTMNAAYLDKELPKTDIQHKTPVSFGLSVSYGLTPRWALQSGLNYTYLSSSWTTNGIYQAKESQIDYF